MQSSSSSLHEEALLSYITSLGFTRCEPSLLQPASVFLDLSGEDVRSRLYLTTDQTGQELCLRPEYTIPVCRAYLASPQAGQPASYYAFGPVFQFQQNGICECKQADIENFGRQDYEANDAEILDLALAAAAAAQSPPLAVCMGDIALLTDILSAMRFSPLWQRRIHFALSKNHPKNHPLETILSLPASSRGDEHTGVLAALAGTDPEGARALVRDLLSIAGISSVGGRSIGEIADRFLEQAALKSSLATMSAEQNQILTEFLSIKGDLTSVARTLRSLCDSAKLEVQERLDRFEMRTDLIAQRGVDLGSITFDSTFGHHLDYYSGFVFEGVEAARPSAQPIIAGGRYDKLMRQLGASCDIPAVGAAIWRHLQS